MNKLMKKKKKGFTLIELIAVIAILAVLAAIAVPRVIKYVEKSKKVAIQTEAATIYNAAEAAYNAGILEAKNSKDFDKITVEEAVNKLKSSENDLLSNTNDSKLTSVQGITLENLKTIMNTDVKNISCNSSGNLTGKFDQSTGAYTPTK